MATLPLSPPAYQPSAPAFPFSQTLPPTFPSAEASSTNSIILSPTSKSDSSHGNSNRESAPAQTSSAHATLLCPDPRHAKLTQKARKCRYCPNPICTACIVKASFQKRPPPPPSSESGGTKIDAYQARRRYLCEKCWDSGKPMVDVRDMLGISITEGQSGDEQIGGEGHKKIQILPATEGTQTPRDLSLGTNKAEVSSTSTVSDNGTSDSLYCTCAPRDDPLCLHCSLNMTTYTTRCIALCAGKDCGGTRLHAENVGGCKCLWCGLPEHPKKGMTRVEKESILAEKHAHMSKHMMQVWLMSEDLRLKREQEMEWMGIDPNAETLAEYDAVPKYSDDRREYLANLLDERSRVPMATLKGVFKDKDGVLRDVNGKALHRPIVPRGESDDLKIGQEASVGESSSSASASRSTPTDGADNESLATFAMNESNDKKDSDDDDDDDDDDEYTLCPPDDRHSLKEDEGELLEGSGKDKGKGKGKQIAQDEDSEGDDWEVLDKPT
ncbi:hypothetical protein MMC25_006119 [Agyrium rufum]|nr:hypothetical protein [Agyrium rufum]